MSIHITTAQATDPSVSAMLREHAREMEAEFGGDTEHLPLQTALASSGAQLWAAWSDGRVVGIVALLPVEEGHGELTSMRTVAAARRRGVGAALLARLLEDAASAGFRRISLQVGAEDFFEPARHLYERRGFQVTGPFGRYRKDPASVFMTMEL